MHADVLTTAREAYGRRAWTQAHKLLASIDETASLAPEDLERLGVAAYMLGLDDQQLEVLARAHHAHLRDGNRPGAVRAAFWLGVHLTIRGEVGRAGCWSTRPATAWSAATSRRQTRFAPWSQATGARRAPRRRTRSASASASAIPT